MGQVSHGPWTPNREQVTQTIECCTASYLCLPHTSGASLTTRRSLPGEDRIIKPRSHVLKNKICRAKIYVCSDLDLYC